MGLFWDLIQQSQLHDRKLHTQSVEERVIALERELDQTRDILIEVIRRLEVRLGEDLDSDGQIG